MRPSLLVPFVLVACEVPEGGSTLEPIEEEEGVVAGRILDTFGEPLVGAEVVADNQVSYDSNLVGITDEDGVYRLELPDLAATWHMTATHTVAYHGQDYHFDLHPIVDDPFAGSDGAVRDFEWRLTGKRPDDGVYGAFVVAYAQPGDVLKLEDVTLTLVPDGPIVDGSDGETISGKLENTPDGDALTDVPVGRYTITAELRSQPLEVKLRNASGGFHDAVTADFEAPYGDLPIYLVDLELRRP